jgi:mRNA interferase HigB
MKVAGREFFEAFIKIRPDAEGLLRAWYHEVKSATWKSPIDVKAKYGQASILKNSRVVFNIGGNKYRLVVAVNYGVGLIRVRWVGTHQAYDKINAEEV